MSAKAHLVLVVAVSVAVSVTGCGEERERPLPAQCTSWFPDVQPIVTAACAECHSGPSAEGNYDLTSYLALLGTGSDDTPNALAGDATSLVLTTLTDDPTEPHRGFDEVAELLQEWVVTCELSHRRSRVHAGGILNPRDGDFHGAAIAELRYEFGECAECHGDNFAGGTSESSCLDCHPAGPTDCTTCHSDLGSNGAHGAHAVVDFGSPEFDAARCADCHVVPDALLDPGHVLTTDGDLDPAPAEVAIGAELAAATPAGYERAGPPTYDPASGQCSNVYCHGGVFNDPAAALAEPTWTAGDAASACGSCHGDPPASHADDRCSACHGEVIDASGELIAPERHIDGVGDVGGGCDGCHGGSDGGPPPDLEGNRLPSVVTVGAHRAHVDATSRLRGPIPCSDCHLQPDEVRSPGHIDTAGPAEVFVAGSDSLAFADGAEPVWTRDNATCAGVYCHGSGEGLGRDTSPGLVREPVWTATGTAQDACGACHGVPPSTAPHNDTMTINECANCHPSDGFGNPIITGPEDARTSLHINGVTNVGAGLVGADSVR